jgi:DNA-binding NtrC family response regulator
MPTRNCWLLDRENGNEHSASAGESDCPVFPWPRDTRMADISTAVGGTLAEQTARFGRVLIEEMLQRHHDNVGAASAAPGMPQKTLYHKIRQFRIPTREPQAESE